MALPALSLVASPPLASAAAERLARHLQTLGDPTRLRILSALELVCVPVSAIVTATGLPQPTVSHHLRILADRGLVRGARQGTRIYYCLEDETVMDAVRGLQALVER
jgi:DNA-binding transcriptional ArsR family regulator